MVAKHAARNAASSTGDAGGTVRAAGSSGSSDTTGVAQAAASSHAVFPQKPHEEVEARERLESLVSSVERSRTVTSHVAAPSGLPAASASDGTTSVIVRMSDGTSTRLSAYSSPSTRARASPGVRKVTVNGLPFTRTDNGPSSTTRSGTSDTASPSSRQAEKSRKDMGEN